MKYAAYKIHPKGSYAKCELPSGNRMPLEECLDESENSFDDEVEMTFKEIVQEYRELRNS